jgi:L-aspartate oxidase
LRERATDKVRRLEGVCVSLAVSDGRCVGAWVLTDGHLVFVQAGSIVLATGGVGALYESTTNPSGATGDGLILAWEAGAGLADLEFVQFHPTALAVGEGHQRPLITEALRGAGAHVVDASGRRFLFGHHSDGELGPRDVVARAIASRRSWLDCRHLDPTVLEQEFPTVVSSCRAAGIDPVHDLIPVTPAAHYFIGGVQTDLDGRASIPRLYAVGECSSTGVHGANRLAGNSLAEALVFGRRAARAIAGQRIGTVKSNPTPCILHPVDVDVDAGWRWLRRVCASAMGLERTAATLRGVDEQLDQLSILPLSTDPAAVELRGGALTARLMARSAALRAESRGVHHRSDHPDPDPHWAGIRLRVAQG